VELTPAQTSESLVKTNRMIAAGLLAIYLVACSSYHTIADPATALQPSPKPIHSVRVTLHDGKKFVLKDAMVYGDSLRGFTLNGRAQSVALADLAKVEAPKTNVAATVGVIAGATVLLGAVVGAVALAGYSSSSCSISE